ncbi:hypothetical protein CEE44_04120 [Candidatus Woesearchaeota archaeon B3_Woes]|nr:MAG: hypothetical protein CEE44_04120 [Candidatus Woesearchaeota archaeon B3_Woes]
MNRREFLGLGKDVAKGVVLASAFSYLSKVFGQEQASGSLDGSFVQEQIGNSLESRISQLQQRIEEKPKDPNLHFELSQLYEEDVDEYYDASLSEFGLAVDNGLKGRSVLSDLSRAGGNMNAIGKKLLNQGKYDEALEAFKSANVLSGGHPITTYNIGLAYHFQGRLDEALDSFKETLNSDKKAKENYQSIGNVYLGKENPKLALLYFNKGKCIDSNFPFFDIGIGRSLMLLEQYDEAVGAFDRGLELYSQKRRLDKEEKQLIKRVKMYRKECVQKQQQVSIR